MCWYTWVWIFLFNGPILWNLYWTYIWLKKDHKKEKCHCLIFRLKSNWKNNVQTELCIAYLAINTNMLERGHVVRYGTLIKYLSNNLYTRIVIYFCCFNATFDHELYWNDRIHIYVKRLKPHKKICLFFQIKLFDLGGCSKKTVRKQCNFLNLE